MLNASRLSRIQEVICEKIPPAFWMIPVRIADQKYVLLKIGTTGVYVECMYVSANF